MTNEFKKVKNNSETRYVLETATGGSTSAGSVASVTGSVGKVQKRGSILAQEADKKKEAPKPRNFVAKNAKMGGAGAHKDKKKEQKQGMAKHKKPYMEALLSRIDQLKSKLDEADTLRSRGGLNSVNKVPRAGQTNFRNIPVGNHPDARINKFTDQDRAAHPDKLKNAIRGSLGTHTKPNLPGSAVDEKGRTQQEWLKLIKAKFPTARIAQAKMMNGPIIAYLDDGRKLTWNKVEQGVAEGSDDLRSGVLSVLQDIYNGAQAGEEMIDTVADELGDYFQDVKRSKDKALRQAYQFMRQQGGEAEGDPQMMAQVAKQAIDMLSQQGVAEGKEDKIAQLKKDHATAVHWSKNETSPQKREAARQKAEKIKGHLEKQYKQGVAEGLDSDQRARLDDLIDQYRTSTDPSYDGYGVDDHYDPDEIIGQIRQEFGDRVASQVEAGADKMHFPRKDHAHGYDPMDWRKPVDRITKAGKMYKQDSDFRKNTIKSRYRLSGKSATEGVDGEYDDEAGMAHSNLLTSARAVMGLLKTIGDKDNLPEWAQEKIAKAEMMLVGVWDYLQSQKDQGIDPQVADQVGEAKGKWDPFSGGDFGQDPHPGQNDGDASPDKQKEKDKWEAMLDYYGTNALVQRALTDLYKQTQGGSYYDSVVTPERYLATISTYSGKTEKKYFPNKQAAHKYAKGALGHVVSFEKIDSKEDDTDLITLPVMLGLGAQRKKWMLKFPDEGYAQKWAFKHKNVAQIMWPGEHELSKPEDTYMESLSTSLASVLQEKAPSGDKYERMVKHIKKGYSKDGKLTDVEKSKAYGAAWKAKNNTKK